MVLPPSNNIRANARILLEYEESGPQYFMQSLQPEGFNHLNHKNTKTKHIRFFSGLHLKTFFLNWF